jgi:hypothetical protein
VTKQGPAEFKWRQFEPQVILMAVGWYLRFSLSYRDVEELVRERGLSVAVSMRLRRRSFQRSAISYVMDLKCEDPILFFVVRVRRNF